MKHECIDNLFIKDDPQFGGLYCSDRGCDFHYQRINTISDKEFIDRIATHRAQVTTQADTIAKLRGALKPFAHEDLSALLGGNVEGGESIIYQRNHAILKSKDFQQARAILAETESK